MQNPTNFGNKIFVIKIIKERGDEILCLAVNSITDMEKHVLAAGNRGLIYVISNDDYEQVNCLTVMYF